MEFRHEWKYEISDSDRMVIRQRLRILAKPDPHAYDGKYFIRSLYFDNLSDKALREKLDGVNRREKFRIRYYNGNTGVIHLEKKSKINGLCGKQSADLSKEEAQAIADGDIRWMADCGRVLVQELYSKMRSRGLRPRTIVDYTREPFLYVPGNVRVTLDYDIRTGLDSTDFMNPDCVVVPVEGRPVILEVKWDAFLPDLIRDGIWLKGRHAGAFSKYASCRMYG